MSKFWKCCAWSLSLSLMATSLMGGEAVKTTNARFADRQVNLAPATDSGEDLFDTHLISRSQESAYETPPPAPAAVSAPRCTDRLYRDNSQMPFDSSASQSPWPNSDTSAMSNNSFGSLSAGQGLLTAQTDVPTMLNPGGYIDNAQIRNIFRLRFDAGFDLNRPDRAEYFYGSWGELSDHPHGIKNENKILPAPHNRGPLRSPQSVNYQEANAYIELQSSDRLSVFAELPFRFVQLKGAIEPNEPDGFDSPGFDDREEHSPKSPQGFSDMQLGFKFALVNDPNFVLTFQSRAFLPTGDSHVGLGTGHFSTENALLLYQRLTDDLSFMGQAKIWTPISGGSNAGNIAIYGAGLSYNVYQEDGFRITPVAEFVGWTILNGFETIGSPQGRDIIHADPSLGVPATHGVQDATGETIVNAKLGVRTYFSPKDDMYVGWGRALTGNRWYEDLLRVEYRRAF